MKIDKHGLKIKNLRIVSGETVNNPDGYSQISYDRATGELLESWHAGSPETSWTEYHDPDVLHVCNTSRHMTMQQLADEVYAAVQLEKRIENETAQL